MNYAIHDRGNGGSVNASRPGGGRPTLTALLKSIVDNDPSKAAELIRRDPRVAVCLIDKPRLYQSKIFHWLYENDTPLHLAAAGYRLEITRILLAAGADANAAGNRRLGRPLHYAADGWIESPSYDAARQVRMIRCLLDAGAELNAADRNGATALHRAVRTRCAAAVEFLLRAGADPAAKNHSGASPFHLAAQNTGRGGSGSVKAKTAQHRIIEAMLARGVSPELKDARGKTVHDWATSDRIRQWLSSPAS